MIITAPKIGNIIGALWIFIVISIVAWRSTHPQDEDDDEQQQQQPPQLTSQVKLSLANGGNRSATYGCSKSNNKNNKFNS